MAGWAAYAKHRDIFKSNLAICLKRQVYNSCVLPAMTYGAETWTLTKQAQKKLAAAQTKMEGIMLNITYKDRRTNIWVRERTKLIDIIYTVRKLNGPGQGISTASKTTDGPRTSPLGDHMTRKDVKGDQPSGGETTWTNTGATRYGRGQYKTGSFGDDMLRPSPNHGTQRLPNDIPGWIELNFQDISDAAYHTNVAINMVSSIYFCVFGGGALVHILNKINVL